MQGDAHRCARKTLDRGEGWQVVGRGSQEGPVSAVRPTPARLISRRRSPGLQHCRPLCPGSSGRRHYGARPGCLA